MRALIIEDELYTAKRLEELILKERDDIEICGMLSRVSEAIEWFNTHPEPDIIFQDIELKDGICFEIYENTSVNAPIIFTTAYSKYAVKSFEVNSIEYLVKPYNQKDISRAFKKLEKTNQQQISTELSLLKEMMLSSKVLPRQRFLKRTGENFEIIQSESIAYFLSEDGMTVAWTKEGHKHLLDHSINSLSQELDQRTFFQISRQCIVNADSIKKISIWFNGRLKLGLNPQSDMDIIVSRERVKKFKTWIDK